MTLSFQNLGLSEATAAHLATLGFSEPTPIQEKAIPHLLAGRDVIGQAQTGTGKTAAFALPILERIDASLRQVQVLILTPTRELAQQVCQSVRGFIRDRRLRVVTVYGGQSIDRQVSALERGAQMVVGTPGRVIDLLERGKLDLSGLSWLVLDEADEMLNMGFIDDVEKILKQAPVERQTTFFSATMAPSIRKLATKFLRSPVTVTVEQPKATPARINQYAYIVPRGWSKARALLPILEIEDPESAIIFVRTRRAAAELTSQLQAAGHSADEYHGDLSQKQRERLLVRFKQQQIRWVVATDIAARGIHVDDLTHVINYDLPDSLENYVHRTGRTGRAGKEGTAISLVFPIERRKLRDIERHVNQRLEMRNMPTRAEIEARQIENLKRWIREALAGERMASFLPIVSQLSEEYDTRAIAAAALQLAYDRGRASRAQAEAAYDQENHWSESRDDEAEYSRPKPRQARRSKTGASSKG